MNRKLRRQIVLRITDQQDAWLARQPQTPSIVIRALLDEAIGTSVTEDLAALGEAETLPRQAERPLADDSAGPQTRPGERTRADPEAGIALVMTTTGQPGYRHRDLRHRMAPAAFAALEGALAGRSLGQDREGDSVVALTDWRRWVQAAAGPSEDPRRPAASGPRPVHLHAQVKCVSSGRDARSRLPK